jgi:hypothetical protein
MSDVSKYLLSFDFDELKESISSTTTTYTDFGEALVSQVGRVMSALDEVAQRSSAVAAATASSEGATSESFKRSSSGLNSTLKMLSRMVQQSDMLTSAVRKMSESKSGGGGSSLEMQEKQAEISEMDTALQEVQAAGVQLQGVAKAHEGLIKSQTKTAEHNASMIGKLAKAEAAGVASQASGLLSAVPGLGMAGGFVAGLIAMMVHGVKVKADQDALTGEIRNVIEASGESLSSEAAMKATTFFSEFAWNAQAMYKISKEESIAVLKTMVDTGYKAKDLMAGYNQYLGEVGKNIPMVSIGLDKTFELQTGTSIKHITSMVTDFGGSLKNATDDFIKISFAAQRSGMGVENYTNAVLSASSSMKQYGVEVESVAVAMSTMQKYYKSMGLNSQYSGARAGEAVQGMADAIGSMPYAQKAAVAMKLFPGMSAVDAAQAFEDGYKRARAGGNMKFFEKAISAMYTELTGDGDGGEAGKIRRLELQTGMANQHAAAIVRLGGDISSGNKLSEASRTEWDSLSKSLEDEKEKVNRTEQLEFKLSMAVAEMGQGLLKVLMGLIALLAHGFMNITGLVRVLISSLPGGDGKYTIDQMMEESDKRWQAISSILGSGLEQSASGLQHGAEAVGDSGIVDIKPILTALSGNTEVVAPENKAVTGDAAGGAVNPMNMGSGPDSPSLWNLPTVAAQEGNVAQVNEALANKKAFEENEASVESGGPRKSLRQRQVVPSSEKVVRPPSTTGKKDAEIPTSAIGAEKQRIEAAQAT